MNPEQALALINRRVNPGKSVSQTLVAVAMSGGVDSAVTAGLYARAGYRVIGVTMRLSNAPNKPSDSTRRRSCCAGIDVEDARNAAALLGIEHVVLDYTRQFRESVIAPFVEAYLDGKTPVPCVMCNQTVKFRDLLGFTEEIGADGLATGHYIRCQNGTHGPELYRARDISRDQSWFLFGTTQHQLKQLHFPLGAITKPETRHIASSLGLALAQKPDSQDICFVPDRNYAAFVDAVRPDSLGRDGDIIDLTGRVLGRHRGVHHYTVGQRRGLGLHISEAGQPRYVIALDPTKRRVVVGSHAALACHEIILQDFNWLGHAEPEPGLRIETMLRSSQAPFPARLFAEPDGSHARITFIDPQYGVSTGQACLILSEDRILGGGTIAGTPQTLPISTDKAHPSV